MKQILSGNEAIARGAYEAGCTFAASYPGTPSTEILEQIAINYKDNIYCHWATNEKVATEMAIGASIGGTRALTTMKAQGINVAADPIFVMGYQGVTGGLVVVCADDPSAHSSQNEQDDRWYAPHAKLLMLEPSDSQECKDFTIAAFELSEKYDVPVLLRVTTRICHSKSLVELNERDTSSAKKYVSMPAKYSTLTVNVRKRHVIREQLLKEAEEYGNDCPFNRVETNPGTSIGVITSGVAYQYAKEVFGDTASYLKLGLTYPLPSKLIVDFAKKYETIYVIEENDPYLELHIKALGISCIGKDKIPICNELNPYIVKNSLFGDQADTYETELQVPARPPVLCAGCPHKGFFYSLIKHRHQFVNFGDIGCYALGWNPPLNGYEAIICMGASISSGAGLAKALEQQGDSRKVLSIIGDSTFFHSGITSLIDAIKTKSNTVICILDNSATAMTGHQPHPGIESNLMGEDVPAIDILKVVKAVGIDDDHIVIVDPVDQEAMHKALDAAYEAVGPFVIMAKRPCALIKEVRRQNAGKYCEVDAELCKGCKNCLKIACPALSFVDGKAVITDTDACTACGLCMQMCKFDAIKKVGA